MLELLSNDKVLKDSGLGTNKLIYTITEGYPSVGYSYVTFYIQGEFLYGLYCRYIKTMSFPMF